MRHEPHQTRFLTSTNERYCRIWSFLRFPATTNRSDPFCTVFPKGSSEPQLTRQGEVVVSAPIFYSKRSTIAQSLNSNLLTE
jgi:hypothetical protein